jgi:hypothetical protein
MYVVCGMVCRWHFSSICWVWYEMFCALGPAKIQMTASKLAQMTFQKPNVQQAYHAAHLADPWVQRSLT